MTQFQNETDDEYCARMLTYALHLAKNRMWVHVGLCLGQIPSEKRNLTLWYAVLGAAMELQK